jgi:hypothetical protein
MVLASYSGTVVIAILTGGLAGAIMTAVFGPIVANRLARHETYRAWQRELGTEVLAKAAVVGKMIRDDVSPPQLLVDELEVFAQRVDLIFANHRGAPKAAMDMWEAASAKPTRIEDFECARTRFVECASGEIRARHAWLTRIGSMRRPAPERRSDV